MAITLLRCVGVISNAPMAMRAVEAGPPTLNPGAQMPGRHEARFVLHVAGRDPYAVADEAFTPVRTARMPGRGGLGDPDVSEQFLAVDGAEVTALRRTDDGSLELRVVNPTDADATLTVAGRTGTVVDLRGEPTGARLDGTLPLGPWKIATIVLDD